MNYQHKGLAAGRWQQLTFIEQMANIGSEVERALNWKVKGNNQHCENAFDRALELIDLTLDGLESYPRLKEITRVREALVDYFMGDNQFAWTEEIWRKYFFYFAYAARRNT